MKKSIVTLIALAISILATSQNIEKYYTIDNSIPSYVLFSNSKSPKVNSFNLKSKSGSLEKMLCLDEGTTAKQTDSYIDNTGGIHVSYREYYKGIEVYGTRYTIHYDKEGNAKQANGNFRSIGNIDISPEITETDALSIAINSIGKDVVATNHPQGNLIIFTKEEPRLAYKFIIKSSFPFSFFTIIIDALSGKLLDKINNVCSAATTVSTLYSGMQTIETHLDSTAYRLSDYTRGNGIETYDFYSSDIFYSSDNSWNDIQQGKRGALDVHWGLEKTYDYFYSRFNRNSYDNNGAKLKAYVGWNIANAFWMSPAMFFGIKNDTSWVSLDIIAHEFTHAVTETTSELETRGESGAINEGISDAFAVCIEKEVKPDNGYRIWQMGDDFGVFRYINNPDCKYYKGYGWMNTNGLDDDGGVHTNMGVFNYWFYLLSMGGNGTNEQNCQFDITGIGLDAAIQICYLMNIAYLTSNATFSDARTCSELAAQSLGYDYFTKLMISEAWYAVGVGNEPNRVAITGSNPLCGEEIYTISGIPAGASVSLGTNTGGFWIQKSSNISFDSYNSTTGELSVQQTTPGDGYIKVYYGDHLLATKEFWVGGPKITNFYYTGNTLFVESSFGLRYFWNINGTQFISADGHKYYPLADGTYNVSVYTTSPNCGAGPTYTTQLHVSGGNMYSLGAISSDHQVSIETIDYSDSPQPLEAMQTMTSKQAAKAVVPYELKNAMTSEVSARGEMPAEGGVLDFSRERRGLYVLTLTPAGREPETFKLSLK